MLKALDVTPPASRADRAGRRGAAARVRRDLFRRQHARRDRPVGVRAVQSRRPRRSRRRRPPAEPRRNHHPGAYLDRQAVVQLAFLPPARLRLDRPTREQIHRPPRHRRQAADAADAAVGPLSPTRVPAPLYLDTLGVPPTPEEARRFLDDPRSDKRSRLDR